MALLEAIGVFLSLASIILFIFSMAGLILGLVNEEGEEIVLSLFGFFVIGGFVFTAVIIFNEVPTHYLFIDAVWLMFILVISTYLICLKESKDLDWVVLRMKARGELD